MRKNLRELKKLKMKSLVVYSSQTGNTRKLAEAVLGRRRRKGTVLVAMVTRQSDIKF